MPKVDEAATQNDNNERITIHYHNISLITLNHHPVTPHYHPMPANHHTSPHVTNKHSSSPPTTATTTTTAVPPLLLISALYLLNLPHFLLRLLLTSPFLALYDFPRSLSCSFTVHTKHNTRSV
ncbi:hypothetical protein E2C01_044275 [Portunus trituberculatus]|uniref:Uncharacterized protein n=1 Tax=Portunus trituberculatus TaxID=210409 RepID=A0A5B7FYE6_PORTR|nr:hypothetical protein [Portunus trituberculatus]